MTGSRMSRRGSVGRIGEQIAARWLEGAGLQVIARNWRCAVGAIRGEIDIVARDGNVLVFCEVKTRRRAGAGDPLVAVTTDKQVRLRRLASAYLASSAAHSDEVRFDVVAVSWPAGGGAAEVVHLRAAF